MNYRIVIISIIIVNAVLFSESLCQKSNIDCRYLTESDSALHHSKGLIDNIGTIDVNWLSERVDVDNIYIWYAKHFNIVIPNVLDTSNIDTELKRRGEIAVNGHKELKWLLNQIRSGDEVWYYTTPDNYWASLSGRDGIILIRKCRIVAEIILSQS